MKLFVGLGNPGREYALNRHNIGFMALDRIAEDHDFDSWQNKFQGQFCEGRLGSKKVLLLKPSTFMNLSGQSVAAVAHFYKLTLDQIFIFHDELDLAPNKLRIKQGGGHAGHNGLRSIHSHLGPDYSRIRLGIGHPGNKNAVSKYVLKDFSKTEQSQVSSLLQGISDGIIHLASDEQSQFMNAVALKKLTPHSPKKVLVKKIKTKPLKTSPDMRSPILRLLDKFK